MLRTARSIAAVVAATAAFAACHGAPPKSPPMGEQVFVDDSYVRSQVAQAEAKRGAGVDELVSMVSLGRGSAKELALRGLGRIGGERATHVLLVSLKEPALVAAAADAIGVLGSLDDLPSATTDMISTALGEALKGDVSLTARVAILTSLGRAGAASSQSFLSAALQSNDRAVREAAVMAMARLGRRKIAWSPNARTQLVALVDDKALGYAVTYALAREHEPPKTGQTALATALARRLAKDAEPMVRAAAAQAIAKQGLVRESNTPLALALLDRDWRVAIEAARALASDKDNDMIGDELANALNNRATWADNSFGFDDQSVVEWMRIMLPYASRPLVQPAIALAVTKGQEQAPITRMWIECLAADAHVRVAKGASYDELVRCPLLPHLVAPLVADLVTEHVGPIAVRRAQVDRMFASDDPRIQSSALGAMAAVWPEVKDSERDAIVGQVESALAAKDTLVAGAAIEAIEGLFEVAKDTPNKKLGALDAALIKRATEETDVELAAAALEMVGKRKLAPDACRARLTGEPVIAAAARTCLRALGEATPDPTEPAAATAPTFPLIVGYEKITWVLTTTRGDIRIELDQRAAPWAVSSIVDLTEKHFYDGLEMHRVVPDFVAQGGDPTQSGAGGPGYTLPAEPSANACFVEGGVGMADAGRDSAGSQWFVMHTWAPHLDARYTCVGRVVDGAKAANTLLIGDRVLAARVERDKP
ncbi:MAG TPA: peptidylprolyl isomerase [Kofleriaceae bacterium]